MDGFIFGIILLLASFFVFLLVGKYLSVGTTVILGIYLVLILLLCYFQKMPSQVISAVLGCIIGVIAGAVYSGIVHKKQAS